MLNPKHTPRVLAISALSLLAGLCGVLKASADGPEIAKFKGSYMSMYWSGFDATAWESYASVEATNGRYGPGKPTLQSTTWANGAVDNSWGGGGGTYREFSASGEGSSTLDINRKVSGMSGNLESSLSGYVSVWDFSGGSYSTYPITAKIQASASSTETFEEHVYTVARAADGWVRVHRRGTTSINAQGTGSIQLVDEGGNVEDFIPAGTSAWDTSMSVGSSGEVYKF